MTFRISIQLALSIAVIAVLNVSCKSPYQSQKKNELVNIYEGPLTTYQRSCQECHGENGSKYLYTFKTLSDDAMSEKIYAMMKGPAKLAAPSDDEINAMIEYHRAIRDNKLFLMVNNAVSVREGFHTSIQGNVTPGATVELRKENAVLPAQLKDCEWKIDGIPKPPFTLIARKDGNETSFPFPERQYSN